MCNSMNMSLTEFLGPNDRTSSTNTWSSMPSIITTLLGEQYHSILCCISDNLSNFLLSLFCTIAAWSFISRLFQLTTDGILSGLIFSLISSYLFQDFPGKLYDLFLARLISCLTSFNWSMCTACLEKNFIFRTQSLKKCEIKSLFNSITTANETFWGFQVVKMKLITLRFFQKRLWQQQAHTSKKLKNRGQWNASAQELLLSLCMLHPPFLWTGIPLPFAQVLALSVPEPE